MKNHTGSNNRLANDESPTRMFCGLMSQCAMLCRCRYAKPAHSCRPTLARAGVDGAAVAAAQAGPPGAAAARDHHEQCVADVTEAVSQHLLRRGEGLLARPSFVERSSGCDNIVAASMRHEFHFCRTKCIFFSVTLGG